MEREVRGEVVREWGDEEEGGLSREVAHAKRTSLFSPEEKKRRKFFRSLLNKKLELSSFLSRED